MKKYVQYSIACLLGGLLLGLVGCGSSNNSCPSGETMTTNGCGTGSCPINGTTGAYVGSTCYALSGSSTSSSYTCSNPETTLQSAPSPYNGEYPANEYGGYLCCLSNINISQYPQYISQYCTTPIMNGTTNGTVGSACPLQGYPPGYVYGGGSTCYYP